MKRLAPTHWGTTKPAQGSASQKKGLPGALPKKAPAGPVLAVPAVCLSVSATAAIQPSRWANRGTLAHSLRGREMLEMIAFDAPLEGVADEPGSIFDRRADLTDGISSQSIRYILCSSTTPATLPNGPTLIQIVNGVCVDNAAGCRAPSDTGRSSSALLLDTGHHGWQYIAPIGALPGRV